MTSTAGNALVGLTGSIASGKSTALTSFSRCGWSTLSADDVVAEILALDQDVRSRIFGRWGEAVFKSCGSIDKQAIGALVFLKEDERKWMEELLHPIVRNRWNSFVQSRPTQRCMIELPLLFENKLENNFSHTISMYAPLNTVLSRLRNRGLDESAGLARINAQMPALHKVERADFVLWGGGSKGFLQDQILGLEPLLK